MPIIVPYTVTDPTGLDFAGDFDELIGQNEHCKGWNIADSQYVTLSGSPSRVVTLADKTGKGYGFTQSTVGSRMLWVPSSTLLGKSAIQTDASPGNASSRFMTRDSTEWYSSFTKVIIAKIDEISSGTGIYSTGSAAQAGKNNMSFLSSGSPYYGAARYLTGTTGDEIDQRVARDPEVWFVSMHSFDADTHTQGVSMQGAAFTVSAPDLTVESATSQVMTLGARSNGAGGSPGYIREVMTFDIAFHTSAAAQLLGYVRAYIRSAYTPYGIPLVS